MNNTWTLSNESVDSVDSKMPIFSPTTKLNNGYEIPVLGLGTWKVNCTLIH